MVVLPSTAYETEPGEGGPATSRAPLTLDEIVRLDPRDILLVTTGSDADRLAVVGENR